jgi:type IV pilus assembly protein PilB
MPIHLEDLLLKEGIISKNRLEEGIFLQKRKGGKLLEVLLSVGFVSEDEVARMYSRRLSLPLLTGDSGKLSPAADQNLEKTITYEIAAKNLVLPLCRTLEYLVVANYDPMNFDLLFTLEKITGNNVKQAVARRSDIRGAIEDFYKK